jgi:hypothetical protein
MIDCFVRVGCGAYKALAAPVLMLKPPTGPLADRINDILRAKKKLQHFDRMRQWLQSQIPVI